MDGPLEFFNTSNMFDFQCIKSAFLLKNGIDENAEVEGKTDEQFDDQYKRVAEILKQKGLS